jgi:hypothetical protein
VKGEYRLLNVPAGNYKLQAELSGFATVVLAKVELLVGQNANIPFTLKIAQVSETLTVLGESPLVDTSSSQVAGNVEPAADGRVAAPGPQLDGAVEARERNHGQRRRQHAGGQPRRTTFS